MITILLVMGVNIQSLFGYKENIVAELHAREQSPIAKLIYASQIIW